MRNYYVWKIIIKLTGLSVYSSFVVQISLLYAGWIKYIPFSFSTLLNDESLLMCMY